MMQSSMLRMPADSAGYCHSGRRLHRSMPLPKIRGKSQLQCMYTRDSEQHFGQAVQQQELQEQQQQLHTQSWQQGQQQQHQQNIHPHAAAGVQTAGLAMLAVKLRWHIHKLAQWCIRHRLQEFVFGKKSSPVLAAAAAAMTFPSLPGGGFADLFTNRVFLAGFWAWFAAQTLKIFTKRVKKGVWDIRAIVDSGGMPSSHSALCAGVTTAIAYHNGMGSSAFALAVAFCSVVMYDAAGVRRHAGKQAEVLNQVIGELLEGHPVSDVKLKEVLGHTPLQVCCGAVLGVLFGIFYPVPAPTSLANSAALVLG